LGRGHELFGDHLSRIKEGFWKKIGIKKSTKYRETPCPFEYVSRYSISFTLPQLGINVVNFVFGCEVSVFLSDKHGRFLDILVMSIS
jgi:hypothetical protein